MVKGKWLRASGLLLAGYISSGLALASEPVPVKALPLAAKEPPAVNTSLRDANYRGSQECFSCHQDEHASWKQSWHASMHRVIEPGIVIADFSGTEITYKNVELDATGKKKVLISPAIRLSREGDSFRFTLLDRDNPANNQTYSIAYVLGGNWNQQFVAQVGTASYPTPMRWIVEDRQWTAKPYDSSWWIADGTPDGRPKRPEEMSRTKTSDATCDGCHTTGFTLAKDTESGTWVSRKVESGIGCEACHGPGSLHVATKQKNDIINPAQLSAEQQNQLCGRCHARMTHKSVQDLTFPLDFRPGEIDLAQQVTFWSYSSNRMNFWPNGFSSKNRQQYHDIQLSSHAKAGVTCITCHDTHSAKRGDAQVRGSKIALCTECHKESTEFYAGSAMERAGVSCADCHMAKTASRSDATRKSREHWDVSSHTFSVILPQAADKKKLKSSCDACHTGTARVKKGTSIMRSQVQVKKKIGEVEKAIVASWFKKDTIYARKLLVTVKIDRSFGAHNPQKALSLLNDALKSLEK